MYISIIVFFILSGNSNYRSFVEKPGKYLLTNTRDYNEGKSLSPINDLIAYA